MQTAIVAGSNVDTDAVIRLSGECRRILAGLKAKAAKNKPAGPSNLAELLAREESDSAA